MRLSDLTCLAQQPGTGGIVAPVRAYLLTHSNTRRSLAQPGGLERARRHSTICQLAKQFEEIYHELARAPNDAVLSRQVRPEKPVLRFRRFQGHPTAQKGTALILTLEAVGQVSAVGQIARKQRRDDGKRRSVTAPGRQTQPQTTIFRHAFRLPQLGSSRGPLNVTITRVPAMAYAPIHMHVFALAALRSKLRCDKIM